MNIKIKLNFFSHNKLNFQKKNPQFNSSYGYFKLESLFFTKQGVLL